MVLRTQKPQHTTPTAPLPQTRESLPASVHPIPTPYMKRQTRLKRMFGRLSLLNTVFVLALLVVIGFAYAWKVSLNSRLGVQTQMAKKLYEENMSLEVELNRLRSFQNIHAKLAKVPHLVPAKEKLQIQSSLEDWNQPILLGKERVIRHPDYTPLAGF